MKIKSNTIILLIIGFIWCIFMGVTAISIGVGALFPTLNYIGKPLACPSGQLSFEQHVANPIPGTTQTTVAWTCTDQQTGAQTDIDPLQMGLYAGPFYGVLLFAVICAGLYYYQRRNPSSAAPDAATTTTLEPRSEPSNLPAQPYVSSAANDRRARKAAAQRAGVREDAMDRMKQLKELRAANMISETEYEEKRAEILKDL